MTASKTARLVYMVLLAFLLVGQTAWGEETDDSYLANEPAKPVDQVSEPAPVPDAKGTLPPKAAQQKKRKYLTDDTPRSDSGIFHVGFAAGGNFYFEPQVTSSNQVPTGDYFKDYGFQGGVYFDWNYHELPENIPLGLRGMIGYKYVLNSVHVFAFDGMVRRMWQFSENASFGVGIGGSAAVWYRSVTDLSPTEEILFLPSFIVGAGFEFSPFMVDFKILVNRLGEDSSIGGAELYFGFRL